MQTPDLHHSNSKSLPCRCTRVPANAKHTSWKTILVPSYLQASGNCVLRARESRIPCWAPTPSWQALSPPLRCAVLTAPSNTAVRYGRFWPQAASPWGCSFTMASVTCLSTSRALFFSECWFCAVCWQCRCSLLVLGPKSPWIGGLCWKVARAWSWMEGLGDCFLVVAGKMSRETKHRKDDLWKKS